MMDRFTEAMEEMEKKSPFFCVSCGHPEAIAKETGKAAAAPGETVHDRFSEAVRESEKKSAFICESCGDPQTGRTSTRH